MKQIPKGVKKALEEKGAYKLSNINFSDPRDLFYIEDDLRVHIIGGIHPGLQEFIRKFGTEVKPVNTPKVKDGDYCVLIKNGVRESPFIYAGETESNYHDFYCGCYNNVLLPKR